jgi:hypothetical protein
MQHEVAGQSSSKRQFFAHSGREPNATHVSSAAQGVVHDCWQTRSLAQTFVAPSLSVMQQRLAQSLCCVHRSAHELGIEPQRTQICELVHQGTHGAFGSAHTGSAQIPPIRGLLVGTHRSRPLQSALLVQIAPHRQSPWLTHSCACPCGQPAPGPHALVQVAISASAVTKSQRNPLVRSPCGRSITEVRVMYAAVHLRSNADHARTVQAPSSCARSRPIVIGVPRFGPPRLLV